MLGDTFAKLGESILTTDIYILFFAIVTLFAFFCTLWAAGKIKKEKPGWIEKRFPNLLYHTVRKSYTLFTAFISLFPLFGMLGTVFGLLGLDLAAGDMENIKENFFVALTSTAWGIIFSVVFKIFHAFSKDYVEEQIVASKKAADVKDIDDMEE